jgi:hypothetical protein
MSAVGGRTDCAASWRCAMTASTDTPAAERELTSDVEIWSSSRRVFRPDPPHQPAVKDPLTSAIRIQLTPILANRAGITSVGVSQPGRRWRSSSAPRSSSARCRGRRRTLALARPKRKIRPTEDHLIDPKTRYIWPGRAG